MTYEYVCEACGHQWEAEQSIKDRPLKECVSCGEGKAKRLVSGGTGFLLKGGGWYADLYGSPGSGASKSTEDKARPASASKSDSAAAKSTSDSKATNGSGGAASTPASSAGTSSSAAAPSAKAS